MWKRLSLASILILSSACQLQQKPWGPTTPEAASIQRAVHFDIRLRLPAPMSTQAVAGDIHHLTIKLLDPGNPATVIASKTILPPFAATVSASFPGLADGQYKLSVEAFATADDTASLTAGGPLVSSNVATVTYGEATYGTDAAFVFGGPLQLISGGKWSTTLSLAGATRFVSTLVNTATGNAFGNFGSSSNTLVTRNLPDGTFGAWISAVQNGMATPAQYFGPFSVSNNGGTVTAPSTIALAQPTIDTIAGIGSAAFNGSMPALQASINPSDMAQDAQGNLFIADPTNCVIRKIDTSGNVTTIAGTGSAGNDGLGSPASSKRLVSIQKLVLDSNGDIYFTDSSFGLVRKLSPQGGSYALSDVASVFSPMAITLDAAHNLYVSSNANRVYKLTWNGTSHDGPQLFAGTGTYADAGDGGSATDASFKYIWAMCMDGAGDLLISDSHSYKIRRVHWDGTTQVVDTVAGTGSYGVNGDNGPATSAQVGPVSCMLPQPNGDVILAEFSFFRLRKLARNGSAYDMRFVTSTPGQPQCVAGDSATSFCVGQVDNKVIRLAWNGSSYTQSPLAGNGYARFAGDGGPANDALLSGATNIVTDSQGNLYFFDRDSRRVRKLIPNGGSYTIATIAGNGSYGGPADGSPATSTPLAYISVMAIDSANNLYLTDYVYKRIYKLTGSGTSYTINVIAGNGSFGNGGNDGPALAASFKELQGLAIDATGNIYVADCQDNTIRKLTWNGSAYTVTAYAGSGTGTYAGDNGPALSASFNYPRGLAIDRQGNLYVADSQNSRIRKIAAAGPDHTVSTVVSNAFVWRLAVDPAGGIYASNGAVYRIDPAGTYGPVTSQDTSTWGKGDGGPLYQARTVYTEGIAVSPDGRVYIADQNRIRRISW
jgi:sugar lactone lactonase YvrE